MEILGQDSSCFKFARTQLKESELDTSGEELSNFHSRRFPLSEDFLMNPNLALTATRHWHLLGQLALAYSGNLWRHLLHIKLRRFLGNEKSSCLFAWLFTTEDS